MSYNVKLAHGKGHRPHGRLRRLRDEIEAKKERDARWAKFRDEPHAMLMRNGLCRFCFGFVDDPRHTVYLYSGFPPGTPPPEPYLSGAPLRYRRVELSGTDQIHQQSIFKKAD